MEGLFGRGKDIMADTKEYGSFSDAIARETGIGGDAYAKKVAGAAGKGDALYEGYLDDFFGGDVYGRSSSPGQSTLNFSAALSLKALVCISLTIDSMYSVLLLTPYWSWE